MNRAEHLLVTFAEEASEVAKEASKCLRFGPKDTYPAIGISNADRVIVELNGLFAMIEMLQDGGILRAGNLRDEVSVSHKKAAVERNLIYSKECGTLEETP